MRYMIWTAISHGHIKITDHYCRITLVYNKYLYLPQSEIVLAATQIRQYLVFSFFELCNHKYFFATA